MARPLSLEYPSGSGRLGSALDATDSVALRGMRLVRSVHKFGYGHKFEVQAAASVLARGA
jgi:hypothetical protein